MSRNRFYTLIILAISFLPILGCEKKGRDNPLDPTNTKTSGDPFRLEATIGNGGVVLSWTPVSLGTLEGYNIYRSSSESSGYVNIAQVPKEGNSYTDVSVKNGRSYYYRVSTFGGAEESDYTNVAAVHVNTDPVLVINSNSVYTSTRSVSLTILADTATEMWISNSSDFSDGAWEDYSTSKEWLLPGGEGAKVVYLKVKYPDDEISRVVSDSIEVQPMSPSVVINENREYTATGPVTLTLSAQGAVQMMISNDPSFAGLSWEDYSPTKAWMLSDEDGLKIVYAKFKNDFEVESEVVSDEIILDTVAPTSTITSPSDGDTLSGDSLTIVGIASVGEGAGLLIPETEVPAPSSGISKVEVSIDGGKTWNPATGTTDWSYEWELPRKGGTYTVMSRAIDDAGNMETGIERVEVIVKRYYALEFDGRNDYVEVDDDKSFDFTGSITVEGWFKTDKIGLQHIVDKYHMNDRGFRFLINEQNDTGFNLGSIKVTSKGKGKPVSVGKWYHFAAVYDDTDNSLKLFVDGSLVDKVDCSTEVIAPNSSEVLRMSGRSQGGTFKLDGILDEVHISNIARYKSNFTPRTYFEPDEYTVGLWHFNEGEGNTAYDSSSYGNDGTIHGARWVEVER